MQLQKKWDGTKKGLDKMCARKKVGFGRKQEIELFQAF